MICGNPPGFCSSGCVPGCPSDAGCGESEICGGDARCAPKPCQDDAGWTASFVGFTGTCHRRPCEFDAACNGNYCVLGLCYTSPGNCQGPPPP